MIGPRTPADDDRSADDQPADPVGRAVAEALGEILVGADIELSYTAPAGRLGAPPRSDAIAVATGPGPGDGRTTISVRLHPRLAELVGEDRRGSLEELLDALPDAGVRTAARFRSAGTDQPTSVGAPLRRAIRDTLAAEILSDYSESRIGRPIRSELIADTIDYLIELSGSRVEAHALTHGVVITDVLEDVPRLEFRYPADVQFAKRAPLLFDGRRSVLVIDPSGRARTEVQHHRLDRLARASTPVSTGAETSPESGSLVAETTAVLGGLGLFVRADRTIWTFVDGQPLLVRRGEHWTAFPLRLSASISGMIGGGEVATLVARVAFMISARPEGAILAIVDGPERLDGVVSLKDRYDLRDEIDPNAMRAETRLHHLIDAEVLDEHTLARLATLDGATVLDREGRLLAYGAIVTSSDSQHEGARTAAARTLSEAAEVVLKVSVDGDITIFRDGAVLTTVLGSPGKP